MDSQYLTETEQRAAIRHPVMHRISTIFDNLGKLSPSAVVNLKNEGERCGVEFIFASQNSQKMQKITFRMNFFRAMCS